MSKNPVFTYSEEETQKVIQFNMEGSIPEAVAFLGNAATSAIATGIKILVEEYALKEGVTIEDASNHLCTIVASQVAKEVEKLKEYSVKQGEAVCNKTSH